MTGAGQANCALSNRRCVHPRLAAEASAADARVQPMAPPSKPELVVPERVSRLKQRIGKIKAQMRDSARWTR